MSVSVTCPCGATFQVIPSRADRARFCSRVCKGRSEFPSKPAFRRTGPAWNSGTSGLLPSGANNANWKGDGVGYSSLHRWLYRHFGKASTCEHCGSTSRVEWANRTGRYLRDRSDWLTLCRVCHRRYDIETGQLGAARRLFSSTGLRIA
jgi:hypothetical protein